MKYRALLVFAAWVTIAVTSGCPKPRTPSSGSTSDPRIPAPETDVINGDSASKIIFLSQNWPPDETLRFYSQSHGSQLVPYSWFLELEQAGDGDQETERFRSDRNMRRLGFLPQKPNADFGNPHGLPIGFAKDENLDWMGFNCAACHTSQINFEGTGIRLDGAPALADVDTFLRELTAALRRALDRPAVFNRFAAKVLPKTGRPPSELDLELLKQKLNAVVQRRENYNRRNLVGHGTVEREAWGHGRIDAFGTILNQVTSLRLQVPENAEPANAPVSIPFLWDTPHHKVVQWNGVAKNNAILGFEFGALGRNVGEVLGVFGEVRLEKPLLDIWPGYPSSVRFQNLRDAENFIRTLWSPQWPADVFKHPLKAELIEQGRTVYEKKKCLNCHALIDRRDENRTAKERMISIGGPTEEPQFNVGTDSQMAANFATDRKTGTFLEGQSKYFSVETFGPRAPAGELLAHVVTGAILHAPANEGQELPPVTEAARVAAEQLRYKARPLNGIWATAPFLHNGSVPSLRALLGPVDKRPDKFVVGRREYDPQEVGFKYQLDEGVALGFKPLDTSVIGNSNQGHVYGSEEFAWTDETSGATQTIPRLTSAELEALLEFLRSL
jgi:hypothetical protein